MDFFSNQKAKCFTCDIELGVKNFQRIHHCHRCKVTCCGKCSPYEIQIFYCSEEYEKLKNKPQRVCITCYKDYQYYSMAIHNYDIKWNKQSVLAKKWLKLVKETRKFSTQKLTHFLATSKDQKSLYAVCLEKCIESQQLFAGEFEAVDKDVENGRTDGHTFNYSVREFVGTVQQGVPQLEIRRNISNVLKAAIMYNPLLGYCQGMNYLVGFLLCLSDEEGAFNILAHLFDYILPDKFYQGGAKGTALIGFQAEQHFLKQVIQSKFNQKYFESVNKFVDYYAPQFLLTLLVNSLSASCLIVTWVEMFNSNSFEAIDQAYLLAMEKCAQIIHEGQDQPGIVDIVPRKVTVEWLEKIITVRYFRSFERRVYLEQFYVNQSKIWISDEKLIIFKLGKITNFDKEEIALIQKEYKKYCDAQSVQIIQQNQRRNVVEVLDEGAESDDENSELAIDHQENQWAANNEAEAAQLRNIQGFKQGIRKDSFVILMKRFHCEYSAAPERTMMSFKEKDYETIFDIFDDNLTGILDFREFLICFSVLLRGSLRQKLELFFSAFGSKQHKYLKKMEFETLLHTLVGSIAQQFYDDEWVITQKSLFWDRVNQQNASVSYFGYADVMKLTLDPFIVGMTDKMKQHMSKRRGTCTAMINAFEGQTAVTDAFLQQRAYENSSDEEV